MQIRYTALALAVTTLVAATPLPNNTTSFSNKPASHQGITLKLEYEPEREDKYFEPGDEPKPFFAYPDKDGNLHQELNSTKPYMRATLTFGKNARNKNVRCQFFDSENQTVMVAPSSPNRDFFEEPTDISIGAGKWIWSRKQSLVKKIICNPAIKKLGPESNQFQITLSNKETGENVTTLMDLERDKERIHKTAKRAITFEPTGAKEEKSLGKQGPFSSVTLKVGIFREETDLRCMLKGEDGKVIMVQRDNGTFATFSDYGRGEWTFPATKGKRDNHLLKRLD